MVLSINPYNYNLFQNISQNGAASSAFNLFDTKMSDHILTGKEAMGWALQGTYTLPSDIDFYNKCLEEKDAAQSDIIGLLGKKIVQPTFTSNTVDGITISDSLNRTTELQKIMNGSASYNKVGLWADYWINIDYGKKTKISSYIINSDGNSTVEYPSAWTLQGSNDGNNWDILDTQENQVFTSNQAKEFFVNTKNGYKQYRLVFSDGIVSSNNGELKQVIFKVYEWWSFPGYINPNGHVYYDISQKNLVDEIYDLIGIAWFYGLDTENQRIFLPRNDYFMQMTGNINDVGKYIEAGLPQHTHDMHFNSSGAQGMAGGGAAKDCMPTDPIGKIFRNTGGASNDIYGKSETVQPKSTKMLLYICVGNTIADAAKINAEQLVGEVRNFENIKADKSQLDGPWVLVPSPVAFLEISLPVTTGSTSTYNLASMLPNDNNAYEINLLAEINTLSKTGAIAQAQFNGSGIRQRPSFKLGGNTTAAVSQNFVSTGNCVIAADRNLHINSYVTVGAGSLKVWLYGYRRKGVIYE